MRILFVSIVAASGLFASNAYAQAISGRGIDRATSNQRLEGDFRSYTATQKGRDDNQDASIAALQARVTATENALADLRTAIQQGIAYASAVMTSTTDGTGLDTDSIPITRSGNMSVSAVCPAGFRFTGNYDAPDVPGCGTNRIDTNAVGASRTVCNGERATLTIYCAR